MSIKCDLPLIRGLLYLSEIIEHKTINKAAEANGIKPSNLSALISDFEKQLQVKLLIRTPQGCFPTASGKLFFNLACELKNFIAEIKESCAAWAHVSPSSLKLFVAQNLDLCDYAEFEREFPEIKLIFTENENEADFLILNTAPDIKGLSYSQFEIGSLIRQKIWLCCREENPISLCFFDFMVAKLRPVCALSMPLSSADSDSLDAK